MVSALISSHGALAMPSSLTLCHTLLLACLAFAAGGCASYGFADRAREGGAKPEGALTISVITVSAPASRQLDVQRATLALVGELERCGAKQAMWGDSAGADAVVRCVATRAESVGMDQALISRVEVTCALHAPGGELWEQVHTQASRATQAPGALERFELGRLAETEALVEATTRAACPMLAGRANLWPDPPVETPAHGKETPQ